MSSKTDSALIPKGAFVLVHIDHSKIARETAASAAISLTVIRCAGATRSKAGACLVVFLFFEIIALNGTL